MQGGIICILYCVHQTLYVTDSDPVCMAAICHDLQCGVGGTQARYVSMSSHGTISFIKLPLKSPPMPAPLCADESVFAVHPKLHPGIVYSHTQDKVREPPHTLVYNHTVMYIYICLLHLNTCSSIEHQKTYTKVIILITHSPHSTHPMIHPPLPVSPRSSPYFV